MHRIRSESWNACISQLNSSNRASTVPRTYASESRRHVLDPCRNVPAGAPPPTVLKCCMAVHQVDMRGNHSK
eukprot:1351924-Prorocentrum_lima.AAC.1